MARKIEVVDYRPEWADMFKSELKDTKSIVYIPGSPENGQGIRRQVLQPLPAGFQSLWRQPAEGIPGQVDVLRDGCSDA